MNLNSWHKVCGRGATLSQLQFDQFSDLKVAPLTIGRTAARPLVQAKPANNSWRQDASRRYDQEPIFLPLGSGDSPEPAGADCASNLDGLVSRSILLICVYVCVCLYFEWEHAHVIDKHIISSEL